MYSHPAHSQGPLPAQPSTGERRPHSLHKILLLLAAVLVAWLSAPLEAASPNVVIIYADDLGFADISYNSSRYAGSRGSVPNFVYTPNIDRICNQGIYINDYVTHHVCSPSRAGLLTALHPAKVQSGIGVGGDLPDDAYTIGHHFQNGGYQTCVLGKWHNGKAPDVSNGPGLSPNDFGFNRWVGFHGGSQDNFARLPGTDPTGDNSINWFVDNQRITTEIIDPVHGVPAYMPNILRDEALDFMDTNMAANNPFMIYFAMPTVHGPYHVTRTDLREMCDHFSAQGGDYGRFDWDNVKEWRVNGGPRIADNENLRCHRRKGFSEEYYHGDIEDDNPNSRGFRELVYYTMIYNMDKAVGALIDKVEQAGELENTIFLFTSDNGAVPPGSNGDLRGQKAQVWEGGIKVPTAIWQEGTLDDQHGGDQGTYEHMIQYIDIFPTLSGLAGLPAIPTPNTDGIDCSTGLLTNTPARDLWNNNEFYYGLDNRWASLRNTNYKLHLNHLPGEDHVNEFYDLIADPTESNNLLDGSPSAEVLEKYNVMVDNLNAWFDSGVVNTSYMKPPLSLRQQSQAANPQGDILRLSATLNAVMDDPHSQGLYLTFGRPNFTSSRSSALFANHLIVYDIFIPDGKQNQGAVVCPMFYDDETTKIGPLYRGSNGIDLDGEVFTTQVIPTGVWRRCIAPIGDAAPYRPNDIMLGILGEHPGDYEIWLDNVSVIDQNGNHIFNVWTELADAEISQFRDMWQNGEALDYSSSAGDFSNISLSVGWLSNTPPTIDVDFAETTPSTVAFNSSGSTDNGLITERLWDFGDGSTSTATNPVHTFPGAGSYLVTLTLTDDEGLQSKARITVSTSGSTSGSSPTFGNDGHPWAVPVAGTLRIEAENYDTGVNGIVYNDTTSGNTGNIYRTDDVDIGDNNDDDTYHIGWVSNGEWLTYTIDVAQAGTYQASFRTASKLSTDSSIGIVADGTSVGSITIPTTGGWGTFNTFTTELSLNAGTQELRLNLGGGFNLNWIELTQVSPLAPTYGNNGNPWAVPIAGTLRIEAENYDVGGEGVAYHDTTSSNTGNIYRTDDVDIGDNNDDDTYHVGWMNNGEWLTYTIDVAEAGTYRASFRTARKLSTSSSIEIVPDGSSVGSITIPTSGDWGTFATHDTEISLNAGTQVLRLNIAGGLNLNWLELTKVEEPGGPALLLADSYVQGGSKADDNLDNRDVRVYPGAWQVTYLEFDVSGFSGSQDALLSLHCTYNGSGTIEVFYDNTSAWDESTITFNNRPGVELANKVGEISGSYTIGSDVNIPLSNLPTGTATVTLILQETTGVGITMFDSKDSSVSPDLHPALEILPGGAG